MSLLSQETHFYYILNLHSLKFTFWHKVLQVLTIVYIRVTTTTITMQTSYVTPTISLVYLLCNQTLPLLLTLGHH